MRNILVVILFLFSFGAWAQDCEIFVGVELPACPGNPLTLIATPTADTLKYEWSPGGDTTSYKTIQPLTTTTYTLRVYNDNFDCTTDTTIEVYPSFNVDFEQLGLVCSGSQTSGCQGKVRAIANGSFNPEEYSYQWQAITDPLDSTLALGLCGNEEYNITVMDPYGCSLDTSYEVEAFLSPKVDIYFDPDTTTYAYLQNPVVQFFYDNLSIDSLAIVNQTWNFGDVDDNESPITSDLKSPTHTYDSAFVYPVSLTVTDERGCDTTYTKTYEIKPVDLLIPNIFTPNGDGENDVFAFYTEGDLENQGKEYRELVDLSNYYVRSELVIFNRYGRKVFQTVDYNNDWDGEDLPEGVYYFVLNCEGRYSYDVFKGSVTILR